MATMIGEVYDAFLEAGASPDKARKAAEAVASFEGRSNALEARLTKLEGKVDLLTWMVGFNLAGTVGILLRMITP